MRLFLIQIFLNMQVSGEVRHIAIGHTHFHIARFGDRAIGYHHFVTLFQFQAPSLGDASDWGNFIEKFI
jgi:hypothetical protein